MRKSVLNFLLVLMVGLSLASCGDSDNTSNGNTSSSNPITDGSDGSGELSTCDSASSVSNFIDRVRDRKFLKDYYDHTTYYLMDWEVETSSGEFLGFIPYNSSRIRQKGNFTRSGVRKENTATHEVGNHKNTVRDYLVDVLTNSQILSFNGSYIAVKTQSDEVIGISLCYPIAANPVYRYDIDSQEGYSFSGYTRSYSNY